MALSSFPSQTKSRNCHKKHWQLKAHETHCGKGGTRKPRAATLEADVYVCHNTWPQCLQGYTPTHAPNRYPVLHQACLGLFPSPWHSYPVFTDKAGERNGFCRMGHAGFLLIHHKEEEKGDCLPFQKSGILDEFRPRLHMKKWLGSSDVGRSRA